METQTFKPNLNGTVKLLTSRTLQVQKEILDVITENPKAKDLMLGRPAL